MTRPPLIAKISGKDLYDSAYLHLPIGKFEDVLPETLLRWGGVSPDITTAVLKAHPEMPFQSQAEVISIEHEKFLDGASPDEVRDLFILRTAAQSRHVDPVVWADRIDSRLSDILDVHVMSAGLLVIKGEHDLNSPEAIAKLQADVRGVSHIPHTSAEM